MHTFSLIRIPNFFYISKGSLYCMMTTPYIFDNVLNVANYIDALMLESAKIQIFVRQFHAKERRKRCLLFQLLHHL